MKKLLSCCTLLALSVFAYQAASAQIILSEDFESGFPAGWIQQTASTDGGWNWGNDASLSSAYLPFPPHTNFVATNDDACNCDKSADRLISPALDFSGLAGVTMDVEVWFGGFTYGGATEQMRIEVSTDGGSTFTTVMDVMGEGSIEWYPLTVNLSAYAGMSGVHVVFFYNDGGGWTYGAGIDDIVIEAPAAYDVSVTDIEFNSYEAAGPVSISGTIENLGATTITSFDLNYSIDGGSTVTQTISGVSIPLFGSYNYTHPTDWIAAVSSSQQNVDVWATNLNGGNADEVTANDHRIESLYIVPEVRDRHVITEHFTSTNCPPCGVLNPALEAVLSPRNNVTNIEYHVYWPQNTDPFYNYYPEGPEARVDYYSNVFAPWIWLDGSELEEGLNTIIADPGTVDLRGAFGSIFTIDASATVDAATNELVIDAELTSLADYWNSNLSVHTVIMEHYIPGPNPDPFPNDETEFHNTVRRMLPSPSGAPVTALTQGATQDIGTTFTLDPIEMDINETVIAIFVQDETTREVMQGAYIEPTISVGVEDNAITNEIKVFPNPAENFTTVAFQLASTQDMTLELIDATGRVIRNLGVATYQAGQHQVNIDLTELSTGVYFVAMTTENGKQLEQFNVIK